MKYRLKLKEKIVNCKNENEREKLLNEYRIAFPEEYLLIRRLYPITKNNEKENN